MIEVRIERNRRGDIIRFTGFGHASSQKKQKIATFFKSKKSGGDIVCAAVSALLLTSVMSLKEFIGDGIKIKQKKGFLEGKLEVNENLRTKANVILETMMMGLRCIEKDYKEHLKVIEIGGERDGS